MPGKPHSDEARERVLELSAKGTRTRHIARETGIPQRTCSDWIQRAVDDGTLEAARARLRAAQGEPEGAEPPDDATGDDAPQGARRKPPRPSRLDVLHDALARLTATASSDFEDPRTRVQAEGTIGRIVELIDRMTQGEDVAAEIDGLAITAEEARACVAHVQELRRRAALPQHEHMAELEAGADRDLDETIETLRNIPSYVEAACELFALLATEPRLAERLRVGDAATLGWRGFGVWRRVLKALPESALAHELGEPEGEALAVMLERDLAAYRERRAQEEANRKAAAEAEAARERLAKDRAARWVSAVERDVLR